MSCIIASGWFSAQFCLVDEFAKQYFLRSSSVKLATGVIFMELIIQACDFSRIFSFLQISLCLKSLLKEEKISSHQVKKEK